MTQEPAHQCSVVPHPAQVLLVPTPAESPQSVVVTPLGTPKLLSPSHTLGKTHSL